MIGLWSCIRVAPLTAKDVLCGQMGGSHLGLWVCFYGWLPLSSNLMMCWVYSLWVALSSKSHVCCVGVAPLLAAVDEGSCGWCGSPIRKTLVSHQSNV